MNPHFFNSEHSFSDQRWCFFILNAFVWTLLAILMVARITATGWTVGSIGVFALFLALQTQVVYGFVLAMTGWWILRHRDDWLRIELRNEKNECSPDLTLTAIVMPICNEDVGRVFAGLRVMYESLQATGRAESFDFFILSDSTNLDVWIAEEKAWFAFCKQVNGFGRVFYRKRRLTLHHKSGNIADFCRRWGGKYDNLIVLDADSVMTGPAIVRLTSFMASNPRVGIIQTFTRPVLGQSLFQRIQQFASYLYGPLFAAGADYWQLNNSSFYGHNAIIRVKPFMMFCATPELPSAGRLGTRILSHDTVEAALIRRAGFEVWSYYDLDGSYEESPPHLLASLKRDRRWCHGNMQHIWLLFSRGLTMPSRVNILIGMMAYAGSPLWLLFLLFSPSIFVGPGAPVTGAFLFVSTMCLLLLPKLLAMSRLMGRPTEMAAAGGYFSLLFSVISEALSSILLAPILMLCYTQFIWASWFGASITWGRQERTDESGVSWLNVTKVHLGHTLIALAFGTLALWLAPAIFPWLALVLIGPLLAIPYSYCTASVRLGMLSRRIGLFLIPEETTQPRIELSRLAEPIKSSADQRWQAVHLASEMGLAETVLDPYVNALHVSLLRERTESSFHKRQYLKGLCESLLKNGPAALAPQDKKNILWDAESMVELHQRLWAGLTSDLHPWWQGVFRDYLVVHCSDTVK